MLRFLLPSLPQKWVHEVDERLWDVFGGEVKPPEANLEETDIAERLNARLWRDAVQARPELFDAMFAECPFNEGRIYDNRMLAEAFFAARAAEAGKAPMEFLFGISPELDDIFFVADDRDLAVKLMYRNAPIEFLRVLRDAWGGPLRIRKAVSGGRLDLLNRDDMASMMSVLASSFTGLEYAGLYLERGVTGAALAALSSNPRNEKAIVSAAMRGVDAMYAVAAVASGITDVRAIIEGWENGRVPVEYLLTLSTDGERVV